MNRWRCIKQYIKSVSAAHENVSETSVYLTNIALVAFNLTVLLRLEGIRMALLGMRTSIQRNFCHTVQQ